VICHQVNCKRVAGKGLAKQIRKKYPEWYDRRCNMFGVVAGGVGGLLVIIIVIILVAIGNLLDWLLGIE